MKKAAASIPRLYKILKEKGTSTVERVKTRTTTAKERVKAEPEKLQTTANVATIAGVSQQSMDKYNKEPRSVPGNYVGPVSMARSVVAGDVPMAMAAVAGAGALGALVAGKEMKEALAVGVLIGGIFYAGSVVAETEAGGKEYAGYVVAETQAGGKEHAGSVVAETKAGGKEQGQS